MEAHIRIHFEGVRAEQKDILVARMDLLGFEGFEEGHNYLNAYIRESGFQEEELKELSTDMSLNYSVEVLPPQNWNQSWESQFHPVVVDQFCAIRASFHEPIPDLTYEIVITPKMSFGTGHHATTYMMIQWMSELQASGKTVLDFGTGTGVLAILASLQGAKEIKAIDNDDWSILNAAENFELNNIQGIDLERKDSVAFAEPFDMILANINKNVLLASMESLKQHLKQDGVLIMSGLLKGDREAIEEKAMHSGLVIRGLKEREGWISIVCVNPKG
ncbi:MAG: 50S ribosomal protein L11 methyltransferase [Chitinophagaceae bacterium]|nr:50S ribosomal protein L11 methyltransferase [Chitinophagaceae bacterium]